MRVATKCAPIRLDLQAVTSITDGLVITTGFDVCQMLLWLLLQEHRVSKLPVQRSKRFTDVQVNVETSDFAGSYLITGF